MSIFMHQGRRAEAFCMQISLYIYHKFYENCKHYKAFQKPSKKFIDSYVVYI